MSDTSESQFREELSQLVHRYSDDLDSEQIVEALELYTEVARNTLD